MDLQLLDRVIGDVVLVSQPLDVLDLDGAQCPVVRHVVDTAERNLREPSVVDVSGMSGYGTVKVSIPPNVVTGGNAPSTSTDNVGTYVPATVTINQASGQADPTSGAPVRFTVTFSKAVAGFTGAKVSLGAGRLRPGPWWRR